MDFSYEYTAEQEAFRAEVVEWLNRNAPADGSALFDSPDDSDALRELTLRLGRVGWLAPSEPERNGGAGLSADLTVVALEELNRRGLLRLVEDEAQALRTALTVWDARPDAARIRSPGDGRAHGVEARGHAVSDRRRRAPGPRLGRHRGGA